MFNPKSFLHSLMKDEQFYQKIIFRGGLLAAVLATTVHEVPKKLPQFHVSPIQPPTTHLNTPIKRLQPHLPSTWSNLLRL